MVWCCCSAWYRSCPPICRRGAPRASIQSPPCAQSSNLFEAERPDDSALQSAARAADSTERLEELFEAHGDRLYRLARRLTATPDEARDLVQDTFLRAASKLGTVPHPAADAQAWLVRVLINLRRDQWRKAAVRTRHRIEPVYEKAPDVESQLIARNTIWKALDLLPPRRRAVVTLHELEGLGIPEIASILGITTITTRWHLARARLDLSRILKGERQ